jgi:DNA ligase-1
VSRFRIEYRRGDLHLPDLGLWLDPHEPQLGPEQVFVSHAHSDHTAAHREVILSAPTAKLMQARVPGQRLEHVMEFGQTAEFKGNGRSFEITLVPAGHIFGSAMALIRLDGESLLYTGDFKLRRGLSAEVCEPRKADVLIMETTYGRLHYRFPPTKDVLEGVVRFCREALDNDETAVLLGYSLGKSQEILCSLGEAGLPLMLHGAVFRLTQIYEQFGVCFPKYERYEAGSAPGKVLLCPPNVTNSAMLRNLGRTRTAVLTGWAVDPNCRYRYQCDAAFPLSDHADFSDLIELVKQVQPKKVLTLHGFAADFAQTLRQLGYQAQALSEDEQLALALAVGDQQDTPSSRIHGGAAVRKGNNVADSVPSGPAGISNSKSESSNNRGAPFHSFADTCARVAAESSKLAKITLVAEYLRSLDADVVGLAATWFSGHPFASSQNKVLQLGWAVMRDALCAIGGVEEEAFHQIYLKHSDSGETAFEILQKRAVQPTFTMQEAAALFERLSAARGPLAKTPLLTHALERCTALEAKFLVKIIAGDLRIGLREGLIEDAIASAFGTTGQAVRQANLLVGDIGEIARLAKENRLGEATLSPFRPVRFMLASPEATGAGIWARVEEWNREKFQAPISKIQGNTDEKLQGPTSNIQRSTGDQASNPAEESLVTSPATPPEPVWIEDKYDGIRCQLHKVGQRVALYSRDLKEITATFLELADHARKSPGDFILDGEIVAMRGTEVLPFAELQKRLGRKEHDLFMREEVPIQFVTFDLLWLSGTSLLNEPLRERRSSLENLARDQSWLQLARITQAASVEEIENAFTAARGRKNEGLMIKEPASFYTPGRRGLAWLKLKKAFATLDCVVVGAEYGHGKRNKVLSDYTFAVRDERTGELKTIGKAYSGLTDAEIAQLTEHFLKRAIRQQGRYFEVEPDTILEIAFDRIAPSDRHSSGLALRFPRILRIRTDKPLTEIDTVASARSLVAKEPMRKGTNREGKV